MTTTEKLSRYVLPTYGRFSIAPIRGEGVWLWDSSGARYLDFCCGIAVCALGHSHPRLTAALSHQAGQLLHCSNLYEIPQQADLAELIVERCVGLPGKMFFSNSGAEANDGLIKLARRFGLATPNKNGDARYEIITFTKSFHGRTLGSMAATGQDKIKEGFAPLLPGFVHVPYNDALSVKEAINHNTAAVLLEPIQGEGGVHVAEPDFLLAVKRLCEDHDLLFLLDEVQCGFGRSGNMMGWRSIVPAIEPDAISWAKGMGGGFPIGGFWVSDRLLSDDTTPLSSVLGPGSHGSTYGGNPFACTASHAVLTEILDHHLPANAADREQQIRREIASWNHPAITQIRGLGLMLGIGLQTELLNAPDGTTPAIHLCTRLMANGLLVPPAGPDTIRFLPPLNLSDEEADHGLSILRATLDELA
jgi:predicted acetylornithine/succinylornithine family transaminase